MSWGRRPVREKHRESSGGGGGEVRSKLRNMKTNFVLFRSSEAGMKA